MIAVRAGWQLETHAIGDRAIDEVLDSYAAVMKELDLKDASLPYRSRRHLHASHSKTPEELNVLVDGNPPFVYWIGSWFKKYGPERVRWSYPAKSYIENGIIEGAGSDVPVTPSARGGEFTLRSRARTSPPAKFSRPRNALRSRSDRSTRSTAPTWVSRKKKRLPGIRQTRRLYRLDRDIYSVPTEQLKDVQVLETYVGGAQVSRAQ